MVWFPLSVGAESLLLLGDGFLRSVRDCVVETLLIVASWWLGALRLVGWFRLVLLKLGSGVWTHDSRASKLTVQFNWVSSYLRRAAYAYALSEASLRLRRLLRFLPAV